jgi:hypothetical protein
MKMTERNLLRNIDLVFPLIEDHLNFDEERRAKRYGKSNNKISVSKLINGMKESKMSLGDLLVLTNIDIEKFLFILMTGTVNRQELKYLQNLSVLKSKRKNGNAQPNK